MSSFLDAQLGIIQNDGVEIDAEGALNFKNGLRAERNVTAGSIDVSSTGTFTNDAVGGGNAQLKVAPEQTAAVVTLLTATNVDNDFDPVANGYYQFGVNIVVQQITTLSHHRVSAVIDAKRDGGVMTIIGLQTDLPGGDDDTAQVVLTLTATGGSLRVNLANTTGETLNGYVQVGWLKTDLVS
jgi:hypothetical protein